MEAFVYSWSDHKTAKIYVGVHKGDTEDGYVCSSKPMLVEYNKRPEDFTRQIIAKGTLNDCAALEVAIIKQLLKDKNTCYNRAAGKMIINDFHPMLGRSNSIGGKKAAETRKRKRSEDPEYDLKIRSLCAKGRLGKTSPRKGVVLSDETKEKISNNNYWKNKTGPNAGKTFSEQARQNMRIAALNKPKASKEHREKLSASIKLSWAKRKGEVL